MKQAHQLRVQKQKYVFLPLQATGRFRRAGYGVHRRPEREGQRNAPLYEDGGVPHGRNGEGELFRRFKSSHVPEAYRIAQEVLRVSTLFIMN